MKQSRLKILLLLLLIFSLASCGKSNDSSEVIIAPNTPQPVLSASATTETTSSPKPSISTSTPKIEQSLDISTFFSTENAFLQSVSLGTKSAITSSYVEFTKSSKGIESVQRRTFYSDAQAPSVEVLTFDGENIRRTAVLDDISYTYNFISKNNTNEILLCAPITIGTTWDIPQGKSSITSTNLQLILPFGKINAVEVSTKYDNGETRRHYFSSGIGLVAEYRMNASSEIIGGFELQEREIDRIYTQKIRFFYPVQNASNDSLIQYTSQDVRFVPNMDMRKLFSEKLSTPPVNSALIPISSTVKIQDIHLSDQSVSVDFSSELVTQMDLSRQEEKLLLQSLANTFGEYYQKSKVYLTVEQENYESRYFFFLDDEYWTPNSMNTSPYA